MSKQNSATCRRHECFRRSHPFLIPLRYHGRSRAVRKNLQDRSNGNLAGRSPPLPGSQVATSVSRFLLRPAQPRVIILGPKPDCSGSGSGLLTKPGDWTRQNSGGVRRRRSSASRDWFEHFVHEYPGLRAHAKSSPHFCACPEERSRHYENLVRHFRGAGTLVRDYDYVRTGSQRAQHIRHPIAGAGKEWNDLHQPAARHGGGTPGIAGRRKRR